MKPKDRERRIMRMTDMGCIVCWQIGIPNVPAEIHHLNLDNHAGQKRLGDEFTVPLCPWHHQGHVDSSMMYVNMLETFGPHRKMRLYKFLWPDDAMLIKTNEKIEEAELLATGHL